MIEEAENEDEKTKVQISAEERKKSKLGIGEQNRKSEGNVVRCDVIPASSVENTVDKVTKNSKLDVVKASFENDISEFEDYGSFEPSPYIPKKD